MNWKNYLVVVLLCSMILALAFIHNSGSQTTFQYDPWADINDDGKIDIKDVAYVSRLFGTFGDPVNKTALLYNVNATLTELLSRIDRLNASVTWIQSKVDQLNILVTELQSRVLQLSASVATLNLEIDELRAYLTELESTMEARIPKKGYISISPAAFNPTNDEIDAGVDTYDFIRSSALIVIKSSKTWIDFSAFVNLPQQSIITNMTVWIYDNSNYQIDVWLWRYNLQTDTSDTIASVSTYPPSAKPGKVALYDDTITFPTVDNTKFMYGLTVRFQGDTSFPGDINLRLYGIQIEYEYSQ
jgi:prefoldin subunit 5